MGQPSGTNLRMRTAAAWLAGGGLWVLGAITDHDTGWRFFTAEMLWIVADLLLLAGLIGLARLRPAGDSRPAKVAMAVAIGARVAFLAAETVLIATADNSNVVGDALLPLAAILTAVSMTVYGVAVVRARIWQGPSRFAPLAMGLYPFVGMFPVVAVAGAPNLAAIGGWGVAAVLVGVAVRSATAPRSLRSATAERDVHGLMLRDA